MGIMSSLFGPTQGEISGPAAWLRESGIGTRPTHAGVEMNEARAMTLSAVFACVRAVSEDVAKLPLKLYRRMEPRGKEIQRDDPIHRLVSLEPNTEMGAFDFRQALIANAIMWPGGYAEIERSNGQPGQLWPLHASRVQPRRDREGVLYYEVYDPIGRQTRDVPARDMIHIKGFGDTGIVGFMMAKFASESLGIYAASEQFSATFFGNGAMPRGAVELPEATDKDKAKGLVQSLHDQHGGASKAHQWTVFPSGATAKQFSWNAEDSQLIESLQFRVEDVARWFRMPPHKIQHLLRATFNNIEHMGLEYLQDTIAPWLIRVEQEFRRKLIPGRHDEFFEHTRDALLQADTQARFEAYQKAIESGIMTRNEARDKENLNPYEGGDKFLVQQNMATVEDDGSISPNNEPGDARVEDQAAEGATMSVERAKVLMMPVFVDAAERMIAREVNAIRGKAQGKSGVTAHWLDDFYAKHQDDVASAFRSPARVLASMVGVDEGRAEAAIERYAGQHVGESRSAAIDVSSHDAPHSRLFNEDTLERWQAERPAWIARHLTDEVCNG